MNLLSIMLIITGLGMIGAGIGTALVVIHEFIKAIITHKRGK